MKQVIDHVLYNTDTSVCVACENNGRNYHDIYCYEWCLYRTKKGRWFLYEYGGAATFLATSYGNGTGTVSNSRITPMTKEKVVRFLEKHNLVDVLEEHFSDTIEEA